MKTLKKLMSMLMMIGMVFAFPACGDDDDDEKFQNPEEEEEVVQGSKWSESGNKLIYTRTYSEMGLSFQEKWTFTMEDGECVAAEVALTFPTAQMAEIAYQEYLDEPEEGIEVLRNGKVITMKYTEDDTFIGLDKETLKVFFEAYEGFM